MYSKGCDSPFVSATSLRIVRFGIHDTVRIAVSQFVPRNVGRIAFGASLGVRFYIRPASPAFEQDLSRTEREYLFQFNHGEIPVLKLCSLAVDLECGKRCNCTMPRSFG